MAKEGLAMFDLILVFLVALGYPTAFGLMVLLNEHWGAHADYFRLPLWPATPGQWLWVVFQGVVILWVTVKWLDPRLAAAERAGTPEMLTTAGILVVLVSTGLHLVGRLISDPVWRRRARRRSKAVR